MGSSIDKFTDADLGWCGTGQEFRDGHSYPTGKNLFVSKDSAVLMAAPIAFCRLESDGVNTIANNKISVINLNFSNGRLLEITILVSNISMEELALVFKQKYPDPWKSEIGPAGILRSWKMGGETVSLLGLDVDLVQKTNVYVFYKADTAESVQSMLEKKKIAELEAQRKKALEDF